MADNRGEDGRYKISDAQMRLHTGGFSFGEKADDAARLGASRFTPRKFGVNKVRVMTLCLAPLVPCVLLFLSAWGYSKSIPDGDATTRMLIVGLCSIMGTLLLTGGVYIYITYGQRALELDAQRLIILEGEGMLTANWTEVVPESVRGSAVKTFAFYAAGRRKTVDSLFFPEFDQIVSAINERVDSVQAAMRETTHVL